MKKITIGVEYEIGDTVYLKTDTYQVPRIVVQYMYDNDSVLYVLMAETVKSTHYSIEISVEKNIMLITTN